MRKHLLIILSGLLAFGLCFSSCRTKRGAAVPGAAPTVPHSAPAPDGTDVSASFDALINSYSEWDDVSMPVRLQLNSPSRMSVSGNLRMIRGEAISISLRIIGIEVASLYADNDTVVVSAKVNNKYFAESLSRIRARYGFTLSDIQALLFGQAFTAGQGPLRPDDSGRYSVKPLSETIPGNDYAFSFEPKDMPEWLHWFFVAGGNEGEVPALIGLQVEPDGLNAVDCIFDSPVSSPAGIITSSLRMGTNVKGKNIDCQIILSPDRTTWNSGTKLSPPRIPGGAQRVTSDQIFKMIGNGR